MWSELTEQVNMAHVAPPKNQEELELTDLESKAMPRGKQWMDTGTAYGQE